MVHKRAGHSAHLPRVRRGSGQSQWALDSGSAPLISMGALMPEGYKLYLNDDRTVMVRIWDDGQTEVATRDSSDGMWGPPVIVTEERD